MKKLIATIAAISSLGLGSALADFDPSGWFCDMDVCYSGKMAIETEDHMYGKKVGQEVFIAGLEASTPVCDGDLYFRWTGFFPLDPYNHWSDDADHHQQHDAGNRFLLTLGYTMPVMCLPAPDCFCMDDIQVSVDLGYTYYWWLTDHLTNPYNNVNRSNEIYAGLFTDGLLRPDLYLFYDFNLEQFRLELSIGYTYQLCFCGMEDVALDFNAYIGWLWANKYNGDQYRLTNETDWENSYTYGGISADIVYSLNDCVDIRLGLRWEGNNDGDNTLVNGINKQVNQGGHESTFWWGFGVYFGF